MLIRLYLTERLLFVIPFFVATTFSKLENEDKDINNGMSGEIVMGPPDLNDEEVASLHMPVQLRCDGCRIVAYLLSEAFQKAEAKMPKSRHQLSETELIDVAESVCMSRFESYGVTEIGGKKRLKGPGLDDTSSVPGVSQGGGRWPFRLHQLCSTYVGDMGEEFLYKAYSRDRGNYVAFQKVLCEETGPLAYCSEAVEQQKFSKFDDEL